jgi:hypothetical protein
MKHVDEFKRYKLFQIIKRKSIFNLLLRSIIEIDPGNEINLKTNNQL